MSTLDCDIIHPSADKEKSTHKKKTLIPNPRSDFLSLRCPICTHITTAFSHSNTPILCEECGATLAYPTGGRIKLGENVECRSKINA